MREGLLECAPRAELSGDVTHPAAGVGGGGVNGEVAVPCGSGAGAGGGGVDGEVAVPCVSGAGRKSHGELDSCR